MIPVRALGNELFGSAPISLVPQALSGLGFPCAATIFGHGHRELILDHRESLILSDDAHSYFRWLWSVGPRAYPGSR